MSTTPSWQPKTPIDAVIFDCDGTLSTLEGIDEIAKLNNVGAIVQSLTAKAMNELGVHADLYNKRLELVRPTHAQASALGKTYYANQTLDACAVIQLLKKLNKEVYIASAGLNPAVTIFGELLGIPNSNVFAVDLDFDDQGNYQGFNKNQLLVHHDGKRHIVKELQKKHKNIAHVGDGTNDYVTYDLVTRFVGYGGAVYREHIAKGCEYYINTPSMSAFLPLALTQQEYNDLSPEDADLYLKGLAAINNEQVAIKSLALEEA